MKKQIGIRIETERLALGDYWENELRDFEHGGDGWYEAIREYKAGQEKEEEVATK